MQRYSKSSELQNKLGKIGYFDKKNPKKFWWFKKKHYLCTRNWRNSEKHDARINVRVVTEIGKAKTEQGCSESIQNFGVWCNGNTTDSGPVILGSSPSTPTKEIAKSLKSNNLAIFHFQKWYIFDGIASESRLLQHGFLELWATAITDSSMAARITEIIFFCLKTVVFVGLLDKQC